MTEVDLRDTSEKLRSKHLRTLEVLQAVVNENKELKVKLSSATKSVLSLGNGDSEKQRFVELENELKRVDDTKKHDILQMENKLQMELQVKQREGELQTLQWLAKDKEKSDIIITLTREIKELKSSLEQCRVSSIEIAQLQQDVDISKENLFCLSQYKQDNEDLHQEVLRLKSVIDQEKESALTGNLPLADTETNNLDTQNKDHTMSLPTTLSPKEEFNSLEPGENNLRPDELFVELKQKYDLLLIAYQEIVDRENNQKSSQIEVNHTQSSSNDNLESKLKKTMDTVNRLTAENRALQEEIQRLSKEANAPKANKTAFAMNVNLKKENNLLKVQIEQMKESHKKYLNIIKKQSLNLKFPSGSGKHN